MNHNKTQLKFNISGLLSVGSLVNPVTARSIFSYLLAYQFGRLYLLTSLLSDSVNYIEFKH